MVDTSKIKKYIQTTYSTFLKQDICFLAIGGSLGRGNYIQNWSDADLLLILYEVDSKTLKLVKYCESEITNRFGIEVDTMVSSKFTIEHTLPEQLHGKIKNFLFFFPTIKVLSKRDIRLPKINYAEFVYGFWATYAEQEKNFLRRNIDVEATDRQATEKLLKKNIKIIFLLLKQRYAIKELVPSTYEEVLSVLPQSIPSSVAKKLKEYTAIRNTNALVHMPKVSIMKEIIISTKIFKIISRIMLNDVISIR